MKRNKTRYWYIIPRYAHKIMIRDGADDLKNSGGVAD